MPARPPVSTQRPAPDGMASDGMASDRMAPPQALRGWPLLRPGDRVALVSPSSHQGNYPAEHLLQAREVLAQWGLRVDALPEQQPRHLYFAGTDEQRARQFQDLYGDPAVKALFCTRGGYGAARLLPLLDAQRIAQAPPKPLVGFSDVTSLFGYLHAVAGVGAVHGPCLAAPSAVTSPRKEENLRALHALLFEGARPAYRGEVLHAPDGLPPLQGRLVGGCLAVLVTLLGTPWAPDTRGAILFLEDVDEAPYRVDRMLTHLRAAGVFAGLRAVVFGHLQRCDSEPPGLLRQVLQDVFRNDPFPVVLGLPCGHGDSNLPLPLGALARLGGLPALESGAAPEPGVSAPGAQALLQIL